MVSERLRRLDARGFSLAELVAPLALIAVLFVVASPSLIGYWRISTLRAGAEELARAIGHARQLAIGLNTPVCVAVGNGQVRFGVHQWRRQRARGRVIIVRYADDFVMRFQDEADAQQMVAALAERLAQFRLALHRDKTRLLEFGSSSPSSGSSSSRAWR